MIVASLGQITPETGHDHEVEPICWWEEVEAAFGPEPGGVEGTVEVGTPGEVGLGAADGAVEVRAA